MGKGDFLSRMKRSISIDLLIRPGLSNFLVLLFIWYLAISVYIQSSNPVMSIAERYLYYTKFSWPNFLLTYALFIYIIPHYLGSKQYRNLLLVTAASMVVFIVIRYFNNLHWMPDYYKSWNRNMEIVPQSPGKIFLTEFFRVLQFVLIAYALRFYVEWRLNEVNRKKLENEKLKAELSSLRYQFNPHFLLNAMNNIYYLSLVKSAQTPEAIMKLSELMRYVLHEKEEQVLLKREIEHLKSFLDFHTYRYPGYETELKIEVPENGLMTLVPPLLFITFIENVFKHGSHNNEKCPTKISIRAHDKQLTYQVINMVSEKKTDHGQRHTGLENLRKRLDLLYGKKYSMHTESGDSQYLAVLSIPLEQ
jgi:sensor histidine kinase YesM